MPEGQPATGPTGSSTPPGEPAVNPVKQLRDALDAANKARRDAETRLKEIERAQLTEVERLRAEVAELQPLRDEHGRFASTLESLYGAELDAVPEEKRPQVEALSRSGTWADRLESVRAAKALLPEPQGARPTPAAGTVTTPTARGDARGNAPLSLDAIRNMSQAEVIRRQDEIDRFMESQGRR